MSTRDQIVVHVQTDKAEVELPVPTAGTITELGGEVGDVLEVGATLLQLEPDVAVERFRARTDRGRPRRCVAR